MARAFRDLPIRYKLMRITMSVSAVALVLVSVGLIAYELVAFRDTMIQRLYSYAEMIGINSVSSLLFSDPQSAEETMAALRVRPSIVSAAIYTSEGRLFARYVRSDGVTVFQLPEQLTDEKEGHRFEAGSLYLIHPIVSEGEKIGSVYVQSDLGEMWNRLKLYSAIVAGVWAVSLLTAFQLSSRLQGRISDPILNLAKTAKAVSEQKNYSIRAVAESRDEVGQLVETFNEMLAQIQSRDIALQKTHGELERRVEERTRALQNEVAERKRGEETLKDYATRLEAANKELEAFSYSVSHDLRSPLRSIDGFSLALLEDYRDKFDRQGKEYLNRVRAAAQRMAQLIDDMLELARVTRTEVRRERVDLSLLARNILEDLRKDHPDREVDVVIHEKVVADGDSRLLGVALHNLLGNAWKYTSRHPNARIEFGAEQREGTPVYFVRDDGVGFNMEYSNKLFGVFQRLHAASEFDGTGVGLATVQRIIQRHGGRIWADGKVGKGATFYFTI